MQTFYGYGNWSGSVWFVGMEEGGGNCIEEIEKRIKSWKKTSLNLIDNKDHHKNIGVYDFFERGVLQKSWSKLIRLQLSAENKLGGDEEINKNLIKSVQMNSWGQLDSENALIDLLPLPSPNNSEWHYSVWSDLIYLNSRESYYNKILSTRINFLKHKISEHKPKCVIFYSSSYIHYWNQIIEGDFDIEGKKIKIRTNYIRVLSKDNVCFVQVPQPSSARSNIFWNQTGKIISNYLNQ